MSLLEVTQDLAERTQRWRQIETHCGCPIINNPGLGHLKSSIKNVGLGRMTSSASLARMQTDASQDEGSSNDDPMEDSRSILAAALAMRATTVTSSNALTSHKSLVKMSSRQPIMESSKESLIADENRGQFRSNLFENSEES